MLVRWNNSKQILEAVPEQDVLVMDEVATPDMWQLIVWNDEVNSFDHVIETLIDVCKHSQEQAEQCVWIIHNKGKYGVKNGGYDDLAVMRDAITDRGIGATIEEIANA